MTLFIVKKIYLTRTVKISTVTSLIKEADRISKEIISEESLRSSRFW